MFRRSGELPIYRVVGLLDNVNFARRTVWHASQTEGWSFVFDRKRPAGWQYIAEATDLSRVASGRYDFVISSHVLEHCADSLTALREQLRVLKDGGVLVLLLPHREGTFDRRRPITPLEHLIADAEAKRGEDDMTHGEEILALHDLSLDPGGGTPEQFRERSLRNVENRCFHHHVFDTAAVVALLHYVGVQLLTLETMKPFHIIAVAKKLPVGVLPDNGSFLAVDASWRAASVFEGDRSLG